MSIDRLIVREKFELGVKRRKQIQRERQEAFDLFVRWRSVWHCVSEQQKSDAARCPAVYRGQFTASVRNDLPLQLCCVIGHNNRGQQFLFNKPHSLSVLWPQNRTIQWFCCLEAFYLNSIVCHFYNQDAGLNILDQIIISIQPLSSVQRTTKPTLING